MNPIVYCPMCPPRTFTGTGCHASPISFRVSVCDTHRQQLTKANERYADQHRHELWYELIGATR